MAEVVSFRVPEELAEALRVWGDEAGFQSLGEAARELIRVALGGEAGESAQETREGLVVFSLSAPLFQRLAERAEEAGMSPKDAAASIVTAELQGTFKLEVLEGMDSIRAGLEVLLTGVLLNLTDFEEEEVRSSVREAMAAAGALRR